MAIEIGPDRIIPSDCLTTTRPEGSVKLRDHDPQDLENMPPISVISMMKKTVEKHGDAIALRVKREDVWLEWTYQQYWDEAWLAAKAFIKLGLEPHHSVCILGFNSPEWFITQLGAIMAGAFSAGIYTTNSPESCKYIIENCRAEIVVAEDTKQFDKFPKINEFLPNVKSAIQYTGTPKEGIKSWKELLEIGKQESDEEVNHRIKNIAINQCCVLVYTSGTTGLPKGVMMSHDNLTWMARTTCKFLNISSNDSLVSYLPLSHSAAQMVDVWMAMSAGASVSFADKNALKGTLVHTLREVRPTCFLGVPRVFEKMMEKMQELGKSAPAVKKVIASWAKKTGLDCNKKRLEAEASGASASAASDTISYKWAKKLVFDKVKQNLGLDHTKVIGVGAAPISMESLEYFLSLDIPLLECYGMSETGGPHTGNRPGHHKLGSIGPSIGKCRTKIFNPDSDGEGEIIMSSRNIMMGYLFNEEKTKEAIDEEGWMHSGDLGTQLENEYFKVTGRLKELIITAGGENVAPIPIEDTMKKELPVLSNAMVVGDRKKFLSCLLTFRVETDPDTMEPKDTLTKAAKEWCQEVAGVKVDTLAEILIPGEANEKIMKAIQDGINRVNKQAVSNAQRIQKWTVLPTDFSVPGDELGPTLKLKRHTVLKKYAAYIESLYDI